MYRLVLLSALLVCVAGVPFKSGKPMLDGRIVGGVTTTIDRHPFQVSLQYGGSHICGGSIYTQYWVVTAAHCIIGSAGSFSVRVGSTYYNSGGTTHSVASVLRHPNYNSNTQDYDVALVRVSTAISFNTNVQSIALQCSDVAVGTNVVVTGWGTTTEGGSASTTLREVTVQVVSDSSCSNAYAAYGGITGRMICAAVSGGGKDACQGDSGGPLVANNRLLGIVSWGVGCARSAYPGVYSRVPALCSWITSNAS